MTNTFQKQSASGLDGDQLGLIRLMMMSQGPQTQPIQVAPVQDIGGGIAQGVGNVVNAIQNRRTQSQHYQFLQNIIDQEQQRTALEQATQSAAQARVEASLGLPAGAAGSPAEVQKAILDRQNLEHDRAGRALNLQQTLPQGTNPAVINSLAQDPDLYKGFYDAVGKGQGVQYLQSVFPNINPNTANGANTSQALYGFQPQNDASMLKQTADASTAATNSNILQGQAPALVQQPALTNQTSLANIGKIGAETDKTKTETTGVGLQNDKYGLQNAIANIQYNAAHNLNTPTGAPGHLSPQQYIQQAASFSNSPLADWTKYVNPKPGTSLVNGVNNLYPQVAPPQPQMPSQPGVPMSPVQMLNNGAAGILGLGQGLQNWVTPQNIPQTAIPRNATGGF